MPKGIPKNGTNKGWFKKNVSSWNKNVKCSEKTKKKISESHKGLLVGKKHPMYGKYHTEESKKKMSLAKKGKSGNMLGKHHSEETKRKISEAMKGKSLREKSGNWQGGKSFELYGLKFDNQLKEQTRQKNNYRCQQCFRRQDELYTKSGRRYKLLVHHIDYDKQNNSQNNLVSLCRSCHGQTNFRREDWTNYFKNR